MAPRSLSIAAIEKHGASLLYVSLWPAANTPAYFTALANEANQTRLLEDIWCLPRRHISTIASTMRAKHRKTLERVVAKPTPADIRWSAMVSMLEASGVEVLERAGSRVLLKAGAERIVVHRPHPEPDTGRATAGL